MRLGFFGGTFDPIHCGHLRFAEAAEQRFQLELTYFVAAARPWHKVAPRASYADRYAMLALALEDHATWLPLHIPEAPRAESSAPQPMPPRPGQRDAHHHADATYSVDQVRWVKQRHPNAQLFFLLGADSLLEIHTWKDYVHLLSMCDFIVAPRAGLTLAAAAAHLPRELVKSAGPEQIKLARSTLYWLNGFEDPISSTSFRHEPESGSGLSHETIRVACGEAAGAGGEILPPRVREYIRRAGLYRRLPDQLASEMPTGKGG